MLAFCLGDSHMVLDDDEATGSEAGSDEGYESLEVTMYLSIIHLFIFIIAIQARMHLHWILL